MSSLPVGLQAWNLVVACVYGIIPLGTAWAAWAGGAVPLTPVGVS